MHNPMDRLRPEVHRRRTFEFVTEYGTSLR